MTGFLFVDKPEGPTSHDIVDEVRRNLRRPTSDNRLPKVGHAGTLDPFASGLLIVGVGREATREMHKLVGLDKTYEAVFVLGASSDTDDKTGIITPVPPEEPLTQECIQEAFKKFIGEIEQIPPAYSAIKIGGKKMYEAARKGKPIEAKPRRVKIYSIDLSSRAESRDLSTRPTASVEMTDNKLTETPSLHDSTTPRLSLTISCSSGTYIRAIARDLGKTLCTGGYVESLRRTKIGPFDISEASDQIIPISGVLSRL